MALGFLSPGKAEVRCRYCGSTDVRPSHKAHSSSQHVIYRCRACKHHFKVASSRPRLMLVAGVGMVLLFLVGVGAALFMGDTTEVVYQPRLDTQDSEALAKTEAAAKKGDASAEYNLGWAYWQHDDYLKALPWLKAAAAQGQVDAVYLLGVAYLNGRGTVQNYRTALEQFTDAAMHNHLEAQYQLGIFYRDGLGTPSNKETAYLWLNIAAARGHAESLQMRDRLTMVMTGEEIIRAQEASTQMQKRLHDMKPASAQ
jgi:TPR repeat protein